MRRENPRWEYRRDQHTISPIIGVNFIRVNGKKLG